MSKAYRRLSQCERSCQRTWSAQAVLTSVDSYRLDTFGVGLGKLRKVLFSQLEPKRTQTSERDADQAHCDPRHIAVCRSSSATTDPYDTDHQPTEDIERLTDSTASPLNLRPE